ncbi:hypothetical protein [Paenibacillus popilliae]|uniref:Large exoprotein n=1 Tax=Paenibacillus popilliae ATCC 14706 TaxID=1212764 RepID=M9LYX8_PAEPP|nr:hypothetical protein [Paenibacillus popilliae]GAC41419.1 large exoprotein [Paenibacillus popilliae ATCC 14706]
MMKIATGFQNLSMEQLLDVSGGYWGQATFEAIGTYAEAAGKGALGGAVVTRTLQGAAIGAGAGVAVQAYDDLKYLTGKLFN